MDTATETLTKIFVIFIIYALACLISYACTSGLYYLFTVVMNFCFETNFIFSWKSAFGVWFVILLFNILTGKKI
jgi:hypothetical protein